MATITGHVSAVSRRQNTTSGNPRWLIEFDTGTVLPTENDSSCAFEVSESMVGTKITAHTTSGGQIWRIDPA